MQKGSDFRSKFVLLQLEWWIDYLGHLGLLPYFFPQTMRPKPSPLLLNLLSKKALNLEEKKTSIEDIKPVIGFVPQENSEIVVSCTSVILCLRSVAI